jgi:hypothetical protein
VINVNGYNFFTADEVASKLQMKYSSVITLLRKNNIPQYKHKYIVTEEQILKLKERSNQTKKCFHFDT